MVRLTQLVDRELIIPLQKRFTAELQMSVVFEEATDGEMETIGERGKICESCTKFIDIDGKGRRKCIQSDTTPAWRARGRANLPHSADEIIVEFYECNGQMRNFVIPIDIGGDVLGYVYAGQFLVDRSKDKNLKTMLKKMKEFGVFQDLAIQYATPPKETDIHQIAKDNNISDGEYEEFEKSYKKNLDCDKYKSLEEVIDAVYLLHEFTRTISMLGNAYYIKNLYVRLSNILPKPIEIEYKDDIDRLHDLIHRIELKQAGDFSSKIKEINEITHNLLQEVKSYETEYIEKLLNPYNKGVIKNSSIDGIEVDFEIAKCKYTLRNMEILLRVAEGLVVTSPESINIEEYDIAHSELEKNLNDIINKKETFKVRCRDELSLIKGEIIKQTEDLREQIKRKKESVSEPSIDEIETIFEYLTGKNYGLKTIKERLIEVRVLSDLPDRAREIRKKLRLRYDIIYLNMGGISPTHRDVLKEQEEWSIVNDEFGPVSLTTEELLESPEQMKNILMNTRMAIGKLLHADPDEVIFTANTTHGIELALDSTRFSPKNSQEQPDEIILSSLEHDTAHYCCERICNKFNVHTKPVAFQNNNLSTETIIQNIVKKITNKTKIILLSHITYNTGQIFDVKSIIKGVKEHIQTEGEKCSPLFLIDGAQAVGHIDVNVHDIGCDFYVADGHKWLMGPIGSGFLYAKRAFLENKADFSFYKNYMVIEKYRPKKSSGEKYEPATMNIEPVVGLKAAIGCFYKSNENGVKTFYARIKDLAKSFKELIGSEFGIYDIILNDDALSGIVSLRFKDMDDPKFYDGLRKVLEEQYLIVCRTIKNPHSLRFCVHFTTSEEEINITVSALKSILLKNYPSFAERQMSEKEKREEGERQKEVIKNKRDNVKSKIREEHERHMQIVDQQYKNTILRYKILRGKEATEKFEKKKRELEELKTSLITETEKATTIKELEEIEQNICAVFSKIV